MDSTKTMLNLCPVPMVILDEEEHVLFINESFTRLFGYGITDLPDVNHWFLRAYPNNEEYRNAQKKVWEEASYHFHEEIDFSARSRPANVTCKDGSVRIVEIFGANIGEKSNLIVFIDHTERERQRQENDILIRGLSKAINEVKTLRGILPLCSFCKKIRDDKGYWEQVDIYINKYSEADISHSICPDCMRKHYPEEYEDLQNRTED